MTEDGRMEIQKEKNGKVPNGSPKTGIEGEREKIHSLLEEFIGPGFLQAVASSPVSSDGAKKIEAETGIRGKTGALSGRGVCGHPGVS